MLTYVTLVNLEDTLHEAVVIQVQFDVDSISIRLRVDRRLNPIRLQSLFEKTYATKQKNVKSHVFGF